MKKALYIICLFFVSVLFAEEFSYGDFLYKIKRWNMDIDLLFKIAGIGILVAVLNQVLSKAGREDQAMMTTLTGVIIVLMLVITQISTLFETVRTVFKL